MKEAAAMTRSELQEYGGENPIWGFVQRLAAERWTGQAEVGIDPRIELFVDEGRVYFAQKADDAPLGARLLAVGVLTAEQLRKGSVQLGDTVSLARLFQRDPSVDRDLVELTVDRFAEHLLEQVAEHPTGTVSVHPLRHHPSGVHQWRERSAAPVATDEDAMSALVQAVVSLSGEVPVVRADAPRLAEPNESPMTFDPVVVATVEPEPALPTLSSMPALTPLPTLGATPSAPTAPAAPVAPAPVAPVADAPAPVAASGLPTLAPLRPAAPPPAPAPAPAPAAMSPSPVAPSPVAPSPVAPAVVPTPAAPPAPVAAATMTPPPNGAMMTPPVPGANAAGAPPEGEAEEIWDMVDELLGLPHTTPTASTPSATEKKSRGWLRGRKG